ncbi:MAG: exodeoxyribonuclease VII small subunit [Chloroflexi bacterium]|nr:exodeoxyribonuclease VII small subunit [Chloroflexota bacterium]MBV9543849.1 exodeoxyribonuclease VII small subunit [Chloroflexota bacterium]
MSSKADPSFEAVLQELQTLVERLESGTLDLQQAVELFEHASQLADQCQTILDSAELRVTRIAAEAATPLSDATATDQ